MARSPGWTCQKVTKRVVCKQHNVPRARKCVKCGKPRPPKRYPKHMAALKLDYQAYVFLNGGEFCGVCKAPPKPGRRLNRDHRHKDDGHPRGLLCTTCNRRLKLYITVAWLEAVLAYLRRAGE